jgi:hypothetical protein
VERMLQKIAKQLCGFDEASLMELWERYARKVARFEPSREWEEAAIILTLIQGMRWKNQLFNHHWSESFEKPNPPAPCRTTNFRCFPCTLNRATKTQTHRPGATLPPLPALTARSGARCSASGRSSTTSPLST